jgi:hypothetical protein
VKNFSHHFRSYRHDVTEKARQYACGLMQAGSRKNMDRMEEVVPGSKSRNLQQFLTHSKWDARAVIDHVARDVEALLAEAFEVKTLLEIHDLCRRPIVNVRRTTRGPLKLRALRLPVYVWDGLSASAVKWQLIATRTLGKNPETKISLSNAPESVELVTLAWRQHQRFWVERSFEDAKSQCGMADYQVRKWSAWHHHMALVMMTMLFMLTERLRHKDTHPLLSCSDIEELLSHFLPRRDVTREEVIRQLQHRHRMRQAAIDSHTRIAEERATAPAPG